MENCLISLNPTNIKLKTKKFVSKELVKRYDQKIIIKKKKRKKIKSEDFTVPHYNQYNNILTINYNCKQLKQICKHYHIAKTGNKNILTRRIFTILKLSYNAILIQKIFRSYLLRQFIQQSGPGLFNRDLCVNKTDFLTLENINSIHINNFISIRDDDNFIYGFELYSIQRLIQSCRKNKKNPVLKNPYNRRPLSLKIISMIKKRIRLAKILNFYVAKKDFTKALDKKKKLRFLVIDIFHKFDTFGHTTNFEWFLSLNKFQLMRYIRELKDIWFHRLDLTNDTRKRIHPPHGNPFLNYHRSYIIQKDLYFVQNTIIQIINNIISKGMDNEYRALGVFYVLTALTLVNQNAANTLPWLYESANNHLPN